MTTQTRMTEDNRVVSAPIMTKTHIRLLMLAAFLFLSLISATILVLQPKGDNLTGNHRALESISARYQRMADLYAASIEAETQPAESQRAVEILSFRYQGMADLYASGVNAETYRTLEILSSRYQGMADLYISRNNPDAYRALEIISARYQAQADMYQAQEK